MYDIIPLIALFLVSFILVGISGPTTNEPATVVLENNANLYHNVQSFSENACNSKLTSEISRYSKIIKDIVNYTVNGPEKGKTYEELAKFVDKFGSRIAGSENLENAIDYMVNLLNASGLENVHTEPAVVPHWVRGNESAYMIIPRVQKLAMLGLGGSIGTSVEGITAEVIVVKSFDELKAKADQVRGKIVVYNEDYISYGETVAYRDYAAVEASKLGGVAALVRSITPYSINSPHTGWQDYAENVTNIPVACITIESAEMLWRMYQRGDKIVIQIKMEAQNLPPVISRNTISEFQGTLFKEQVVLKNNMI